VKKITISALRQHRDVLEEKVFQTRTKWPQFELLLDDTELIVKSLMPNQRVICMERTLLYGGYSLLGPFFHNQQFSSIDCSPLSANERGAYNRSLVDDIRFIEIRHSHRYDLEELPALIEPADALLVPNLVHHVRDQVKLFDRLVTLLKPGGLLYVFEPTLRELHQLPDDYIRFTPSGLINCLKTRGLCIERVMTTGGPFSAIAYCWVQALEYIPERERESFANWFYKEHFSELKNWDEMYPINLERKHTSFPVAFSVIAKKRNDP
jgi:hypothetical protein